MTITDEEILEQLRDLKNTGRTKQETEHSHAILLSNTGKSNKEVSEIFGVTPRTIYQWLKDFQNEGIASFACKSGRGRKLLLDPDKHKEIIKKHIDEHPHQPKTAYALTVEDTEVKMSYKTFKRFLKKHSITATSE